MSHVPSSPKNLKKNHIPQKLYELMTEKQVQFLEEQPEENFFVRITKIVKRCLKFYFIKCSKRFQSSETVEGRVAIEHYVTLYELKFEDLNLSQNPENRWLTVKNTKSCTTQYRLCICACGQKPMVKKQETSCKKKRSGIKWKQINKPRRRYNFAQCPAFAVIYTNLTGEVYRLQGYFKHSDGCSRFFCWNFHA
jgi:hypothetical protein